MQHSNIAGMSMTTTGYPSSNDDEDFKAAGYFPFPFAPYDIQEDFMRKLYAAIEEGKIGIFESPTGTVLNDHFDWTAASLISLMLYAGL